MADMSGNVLPSECDVTFFRQQDILAILRFDAALDFLLTFIGIRVRGSGLIIRTRPHIG